MLKHSLFISYFLMEYAKINLNRALYEIKREYPLGDLTKS